ncbi:MAG TPA: branched-chain amino acid ABC transporter permease [Burkholderiales bacterium]|jgi:branched-chain amino acid transport system permease protein|nr:branched-chain amino acid ABC transporter permease [Burkholderiales bacterium]
MDFATFLIQLLNAVQYGLLLFLVASGLTLIFGIMGIINLAHGSFYMIGAYLAWSLSGRLGNFWVAIALGIVLTVLLGMLLEWLLVKRLYGRDHLYQVLLTYGLILIFEELRSIVWGDDVHGVPIPNVLSASIPLTDTLEYPVYRLWMSGVCVVLAVLMYWLIQHTRLGMMIRAGASNRDMTQSLGINIQLLYRLVFALGVALAAFAGMIAAPVSSVFPGMGGQVLIICFVVVVIGGIGSVKGALVAALLIGLVDTFGKVLEIEIGGFRVLPELAGMSVYLLMAIVLLWRPEGLFGKRL